MKKFITGTVAGLVLACVYNRYLKKYVDPKLAEAKAKIQTRLEELKKEAQEKKSAEEAAQEAAAAAAAATEEGK